jgi:hypothetical protein
MCGAAAAEELAAEVDGDQLVPRFDIHVDQRELVERSCGVDEDVDRVELPQALLDRVLGLFRSVRSTVAAAALAPGWR